MTTGDSPSVAGAAIAAPRRRLVPGLMFVGLVLAVVGSLGAPLITPVAGEFGVSLAAAQWTLTAPLLTGAIATPVLGRLGTGPRRRQVVLAALAVVVAGSLLTVVPPSFGWLLAGRVAQGAGLWLPFVVMGVLGLGVGVFSAAMPSAILAVTPAEETSSAMSINQVVRSVGFSIGSALGGLTLAAHTPADATFPTNTGYTTASWLGAAAMALTITAALTLRQARRGTTSVVH